MQNWLLLGGFVLSGLLGLIILPNILFVSHKKHLFDMPDARKVHTAPVPRLGGLAFLPVILVNQAAPVETDPLQHRDQFITVHLQKGKQALQKRQLPADRRNPLNSGGIILKDLLLLGEIHLGVPHIRPLKID